MLRQSLILALGLSLTPMAFAHELDNEQTAETAAAPVQFPTTLVVITNLKTGEKQVASSKEVIQIDKANAKQVAQKLSGLKFAQLAMSERNPMNIDPSKEREETSSTSTWGGGWVVGPRGGAAAWGRGPFGGGAVYRGPGGNWGAVGYRDGYYRPGYGPGYGPAWNGGYARAGVACVDGYYVEGCIAGGQVGWGGGWNGGGSWGGACVDGAFVDGCIGWAGGGGWPRPVIYGAGMGWGFNSIQTVVIDQYQVDCYGGGRYW